MNLRVLLYFVFVSAGIKSQVGWNAVTGFGSNPGNLTMYTYAPSTLPNNAPLVVVLHGCTQTASQYASESGWNALADIHGFYTVYPEQSMLNNGNRCFNWFMYGDQNRGNGEAASIKQMIDYMVSAYSIDTNRIFVTGLSAGACMTNVMLACYPDVFDKGAVMAGTPFKSSTSALTASSAMYGLVTNTPVQWGDSVRHQNPSYTGPFPKVAVFQGGSDMVVNINNVTEQVKQWTNVHATDQTADLIQANFNGNSLVTKTSYYNAASLPVVETYTISLMGHAIAVDPGVCYQQGGTTGTYASDVNFYSSFWAAHFFNILHSPVTISGSATVAPSSAGIIYSVPFVSGNTYTWTVPPGSGIVSGQGTNAITVNFGSSPGNVSVTETNTSGCIIGPADMFVNVAITTNLINHNAKEPELFYNFDNRVVEFKNSNVEQACLYSIDGKLIERYDNNISKLQVGSSIQTGIYILEFKKEAQLYRKKLVIN